jgi:hypothetical protein
VRLCDANKYHIGIYALIKERRDVMPRTIDLYPSTTNSHAVIQQAVDTNDEILLHPRDQSGTPGLKFDIGEKRILVKRPTTIRGVCDPRHPDEKPVIKGSSGWLIFDNKPDGYPGAGIFTIVGSNGSVEITDLCLEHIPDQNPQGQSMHGSATIAYFADNNQESRLRVANCDINTAATSGVSIDAINALSNRAKEHIVIDRCTIKGQDHPDASLAPYVPGNYIGVRLGGMLPGRPPVDMRNGHFEVSHCVIDSAKWAGVTGAFFESDAQSKFDVSANIIGCNPNSPLDVTRVGIIFLDASVMDPSLHSWPKGRITLCDNKIQVQGFFTFPWQEWSAGILVQVNTDLPEQPETTIARNTIDFLQAKLPEWSTNDPTQLVLDGIIYQDDAASAAGWSQKASATIRDNVVVVSGPVKPLRGIWLRKGARHARVHDNDLTKLTASFAQIFVDEQAHNNIIADNLCGGLAPMLGIEPVAVVLCDGDHNKLSCANFSGSGVPGWTHLPGETTYSGGPGRVKLDRDSEFDDVQVDPATFNPAPPNAQWWNASVVPNNNNNVHL